MLMLVLRLLILQKHESVIFKSPVKVLFNFKNAFWHLEICFVLLGRLRLDHFPAFLPILRLQIVQLWGPIIVHMILLFFYTHKKFHEQFTN